MRTYNTHHGANDFKRMVHDLETEKLQFTVENVRLSRKVYEALTSRCRQFGSDASGIIDEALKKHLGV